MGNDIVAAMSSSQLDLLLLAKEALRIHLRIMLSEPQHYLAKFCYAMDFVWARCAFCFLLLLKMTRLPPEADNDAKRRLLKDGNRLLKELNKAGGGWTSGGRSTTSRMYLQVLLQSIQKYGRGVGERLLSTRRKTRNRVAAELLLDQPRLLCGRRDRQASFPSNL